MLKILCNILCACALPVQYPISITELCKRYVRASGEINYFNFTRAERDNVMNYFGTLLPILQHHPRIGDLLLPLALDRVEQAYFCALLLYTAGAAPPRPSLLCPTLSSSLCSHLAPSPLSSPTS